MQPHGKRDIYLGFKDAHSAYVYDPVTIRYIRGHRLLSVELATSSDNTISGVDTTPLLARRLSRVVEEMVWTRSTSSSMTRSIKHRQRGWCIAN
ncbi:hypothetical protein RI054_32g126220 [Pseudoscourfieldia marina]